MKDIRLGHLIRGWEVDQTFHNQRGLGKAKTNKSRRPVQEEKHCACSPRMRSSTWGFRNKTYESWKYRSVWHRIAACSAFFALLLLLYWHRHRIVLRRHSIWHGGSWRWRRWHGLWGCKGEWWKKSRCSILECLDCENNWSARVQDESPNVSLRKIS